jgi:hypothetical protein
LRLQGPRASHPNEKTDKTFPVSPRDAEVLMFEAGCEESCEREVDEVELQSGRVYLHPGARRDEPPWR